MTPPQPPSSPRCEAHGLSLGVCDHCGSTVQLAVWTESLSPAQLTDALGHLIAARSWYTRPEQDALIREAIIRLG